VHRHPSSQYQLSACVHSQSVQLLNYHVNIKRQSIPYMAHFSGAYDWNMNSVHTRLNRIIWFIHHIMHFQPLCIQVTSRINITSHLEFYTSIILVLYIRSLKGATSLSRPRNYNMLITLLESSCFPIIILFN
jgi:hypothetical protein